MESILEFLKTLHSTQGIEQIIASGGLLVIVAIIFAETGLLAGFFFPGDSLLVTAGFLASRGITSEEPLLNIYSLNLSLMAAAISGDQFGFFLGRKTGPKIFDRPDNRFFKKKYVKEAHAFYEKHGGKAIVFARFVPIMRTFVPFIAGVAEMPYRRFVVFNIVGGISWVLSMTLLGYFLGQSPIGEKIHLIVMCVVFVSVLPMIIGLAKRIFSTKSASVESGEARE